MLSTVAALYGHLTATGAVPANPAAVNRRRLRLSGSTRDASPTVKLTPPNLHALLAAAGHLPPTVIHRDLYATRARAFVALLTLGLRISELAGLDRSDRYVSGDEEVLRVVGKGGHHRLVYITDLAGTALDTYLAERDRVAGAALPTQRGRTAAASSPLIATAAGRRCTRTYLYELLRKIAQQARPLIGDELAARVHPHAFRHAYITIALEKGAPIHHVQADAGHATIATTQHYHHGQRTRATSAADLVATAIAFAGRPTDAPGVGHAG
jgi:site-specific recombinase XerD